MKGARWLALQSCEVECGHCVVSTLQGSDIDSAFPVFELQVSN